MKPSAAWASDGSIRSDAESVDMGLPTREPRSQDGESKSGREFYAPSGVFTYTISHRIVVSGKKISHPMKQEITDRFTLNIARVKSLVAIYRNLLAGQGKGRRGHQDTDVLRAATVLLHASVEDVLRSLAYWKLPTAGAQVLDQIPFIGGTATKITLGTLSIHRGKSIDDVIKESVDAGLERSNYNNANEVCSLLQSIGLNTVAIQPYLQKLEDAMKRRHQIVHRADTNQNGGRGNHRVTSISPATVDDWALNTEQFVRTVLTQV